MHVKLQLVSLAASLDTDACCDRPIRPPDPASYFAHPNGLHALRNHGWEPRFLRHSPRAINSILDENKTHVVDKNSEATVVRRLPTGPYNTAGAFPWARVFSRLASVERPHNALPNPIMGGSFTARGNRSTCKLSEQPRSNIGWRVRSNGSLARGAAPRLKIAFHNR